MKVVCCVWRGGKGPPLLRDHLPTLSPDEYTRLAATPTESIEAYEQYLLGRYFWNLFTQAGITRSIEHFEEALRLDSRYALAYTGLADAHSLIGCCILSIAEPPSAANARARTAVDRALELDMFLSEAHSASAASRSVSAPT